MRDNPVRAKIKRGEPVFGTVISDIDTPAVSIWLADAGFDFFFIDMEHGTYDLPGIGNIVRLARQTGIVPLVRVPDASYDSISRVLDAGAMGVMIPRVETRDTVEQAIAASRYPPVGNRGMFHGKGNNDYQAVDPLEFARHANSNILTIIQIERGSAVERLDELLSVPGLDVALIGPVDLAVSLGVALTDRVIAEKAQLVVDAARRHGIASGIHMGTPADVKAWQKRGVTMLSCSTDLEIMRNATQRLVKELHE
jgi:2-keto-3-deoxy-L-rhamnonate aldolase RhmA